MKMIKTLAVSRIKYNRSRTILTAVSIMLTTLLLMGLGCSAVGVLDINRQQAVLSGNNHAALRNLNGKQLSMLQNHMDVEALDIQAVAATVEYEKMNAYLSYKETLKDGIYTGIGNIIEGREARTVDEIYGPTAFFERMGVDAVIGNKVSISFRINGKGMIQTKEFTICGLVSQVDLSDADISDSRIVYGAAVSKAFIEEYMPSDERSYSAVIRVYGEDKLNYDEMKAKIEEVASDIGCKADNINFNSQYLYTMTDPGTETVFIVGVIALIIIIFSGLVIYSIYYVSVITDVQEIGKLKALGASNKQIRRILLSEGLRISVFAIPMGLILGYLIPYLAFPIVVEKMKETIISAMPMENIKLFSLPVMLLAAAAVLVTIILSLLKPMSMAAKVSPIEAIRYQESSNSAKVRKGNRSVNVFKLSVANLMRNKKRTIVTMVTMGLSCVLFMSLAGVMNSMSAQDIARRNIGKGDFRLSLDFSSNDKEYPENNLDYLQQQNIFSDDMINNIENIEGVQKIERSYKVLAGSDFPSPLFEEVDCVSISCMDRERAKQLQKEVKYGEIDYDKMTAENGIAFGAAVFADDYGFNVGDDITLDIHDGNRRIPVTFKLMAMIDIADAYFIMPQDVWDELGLMFDATTDLYISVDKAEYDNAKAALTEIADSYDKFVLYSMDEEMEIGRMSVGLIKYPIYVILVMIAVIGFLNLINTMITSIVTRKRELGILQAVGLSDRQLTRMLAGEGMVFTAGTLFASVTIGNLFGYIVFVWAKKSHFMSISAYHYPLVETILLALVLVLGQLFLTDFIGKRVRKESLIDRIRGNE